MSSEAIRQAIQQLAGTHLNDPITLCRGIVLSVDADTMTCNVEPIDGVATTEIPDVNLMAAVGDGFYLKPAIGSLVLVAFSKNISPYALLCSDVDEILVVAVNKAVHITKEGIQVNNGSFGGVPISEEITKKLNTLENKVNEIISNFNAHTHPVSGNTTTTPINPISGTVSPTRKEDLENKVFTHGE